MAFKLSRVATGQTGSTAAVVLSPLLNLAFTPGTGPRLNQIRPLCPLGNLSICGTAMLSLWPDRRSIDVRLQLNSAAAVSIRLRRLTGDHPDNMHQPEQDDLLVIEIIAVRSGAERSSPRARLSLSNRSACLPLRASELLKEGICLLGHTAPSIQGVRVDPAPPHFGSHATSDRLAERMLMEIEAAESSKSAVAASRHVELANLYARKLKEDGSHLT